MGDGKWREHFFGRRIERKESSKKFEPERFGRVDGVENEGKSYGNRRRIVGRRAGLVGTSREKVSHPFLSFFLLE